MALKKTSTLLPVATTTAAAASKHLIGSAALAPSVDAYFAASAIMDSAKANLDAAKADLTEAAFETWLDKRGASSTVVFTGTTPELAVNVSVKDQYSAMSEDNLDNIIEVIGESAADALLSYDEVIEVKLDAIIEAQRAAFVEGVRALALQLGLDQDVIKLTQKIKPIKDVFHAQRHTLLTPEQNRTLQENGVIKTVISVAARKSAKATK